MPLSEAANLESELVKSANGNTNTLLLILFVLFALSLLTILIRYLMNRIPEEMAKDREYVGKIITDNNNEHCKQLANLVEQVKNLVQSNTENNKAIIDVITKHDDQAKKILDTDNRIETKLDTRPCARIYNDQNNFVKH